MVQSMKARLKEALEDKKEFEIEMLALKRNFLKAKNRAKQLEEQYGAGGLNGDLEKTKQELEQAKAKLSEVDPDVISSKMSGLENDHKNLLEQKSKEFSENIRKAKDAESVAR